MNFSEIKVPIEAVKVSVTAIKFVKNNLLAGIGSDFLVFTYSEKSISLPYVKKKVHQQANIHGICPNDDSSLVALFGGKRLTIVALNLDDPLVKISVEKSWVVKDWIWDVSWTNEQSLLTTVSAHNVLSLWEWKNAEEIETAVCEENCILYSAQLIGNTWQDTVILSGTVFREVVIWLAQGERETHRPVLHRLQGHNGVIFSVNYDDKSKRISSTSDDRTVRLWSVNFESNKNPVAESWKHVSIQLLFTIFGHTSRVWRSQILSDRSIISIGEDSLLCAWNEQGICTWQQESHQGGGIWSVDCNEDLRLIATGGADGGISLWPLDFPTIFPKALPIPPDTPRKLALLSDGKIITVTELGYLLISTGGHWTVAHHDQRMSNYCLLEVSSCKMFIALATIDGDVIINKVNNNSGPIEKIVDMQALEGKIFSMHWLEDHHLLLCGHFGNLSLWKLTVENDSQGELDKIADLSLPYSKERWLTSALLLDFNLICGDRDGSIHVYNLKADKSNNKVVSQTLRRIHGRLGVSSLKCLANRVWSTGRDGTLRQFRVVNSELQSISVDRLSMEWVANLIESPEFGVLVLGFQGVSFVIWSVKERRTLIHIKCGGGHRSWGCSLNNETLNFTFLKDKTAHTLCCHLRDITRPLPLEGYHVKEINSLVKLPINTNRGIWLASGGEDTTVRITQFEKDEFRSENVVRSHLSSVRVVHAIAFDSQSALLFTAGGRAQMKVWKIHIDTSVTPPDISTVEIASEMLQEVKQSRPWWKVEPRNTPETRYMDLNVVKYSKNCLRVLAASSDTFLRIFNFDTTTHKLELQKSLWYSHNCLLKVGSLTWNGDIPVAFSAATDGKIVFWNLNDIEAVSEPFSVLPLHQSGINACDWRTISSESILLATGGDDSCINVCHIQKVVSPSVKAEILSKWTDSDSHCSQITGIKITSDYIISAGIDHRINIMKWDLENDDLKISRTVQYISSVPDIHGLDVWLQGSDFAICVYGAGIQVFHYRLVQTNSEG